MANATPKQDPAAATLNLLCLLVAVVAFPGETIVPGDVDDARDFADWWAIATPGSSTYLPDGRILYRW